MIKTDRILESEMQYIKLSKRNLDGLVLDVGGGGEGIVGKLYGEKTVAIDNRKDELEDTSNKALKIVMDACDMAFIDDSFSMVTFFYTLMYMDTDSKKAALEEACRVLKSGKIVEIWDSEVPQCTGGVPDIFIANVTVDINGEKVKTGYGTAMDGCAQTSGSVCDVLRSCRLEIEGLDNDGHAFHITARKV